MKNIVMTILAPHKQKYCFTMPLACLVGDANAASILSKIHHWVEHGAGRIFDGVRWIHNSYKDFVNEFPWLTVEQVRRFINAMKADGILNVERLTYKTDDVHSYWYSINYEALESLLSQAYMPQPKKSRGRHSGNLTTTSVKLTTTPVKSDRGSVKFNNRSIYTNNSSDQSNKENSNPNAAAFLSSDLDPEEETPTSLASNPSQEVTHETVTEVLDPKDKSSAPARDNRSIEILLAYGFELTRQLERIALKYNREEIQKSLTHLTNCKKTQAIKNGLGWLTSCLQDKWYLSDSSLVQAQPSEGVENETKKEPPKPTWRLMTPEEEEARRLVEEEKNRKAREAMEQWKEQHKDLIREIRAQVALGATAKRNPAVAPPRPPVIEETLEENMARIAKEKVRLLAELRKMRLEESEQGDDLEF